MSFPILLLENRNGSCSVLFIELSSCYLSLYILTVQCIGTVRLIAKKKSSLSPSKRIVRPQFHINFDFLFIELPPFSDPSLLASHSASPNVRRLLPLKLQQLSFFCFAYSNNILGYSIYPMELILTLWCIPTAWMDMNRLEKDSDYFWASSDELRVSDIVPRCLFFSFFSFFSSRSCHSLHSSQYHVSFLRQWDGQPRRVS